MKPFKKLSEVSWAQFFNRQVHWRSLLLVTLLAGIVLAIGLPATAGPLFLPNRTLVNTYFATNKAAVKATCAVAGCTAPPVPLFLAAGPLPIGCPGAAGTTCTFYIHLETDDALTIKDQGLYQFLVAGVAPVPGPTFAGGFFIWDSTDPNSALAFPFSHSYAVTATVKNTAANQAWPVQVNLSCRDIALPAGCTATNFIANLEVQVYKP